MSKIIYPISMTSKGTFTLPARIRKDLGLKVQGDKLLVNYDPSRRKIELEKPADLRKLQKENAKLIPNDLPPFDLKEIRKQKHDAYFKSHFN